MTRLTPLTTSLKTLNITYSLRETLLETPETLPTSEPSSPQITITISESDLPTFSIKPFKVTYVMMILVSGKYTTAGDHNIKFLKNGSSVGSWAYYVSANYYYTRVVFLYDVKVGDVIDIKLWSSVTGSDWRYKAYEIEPTRLYFLARTKTYQPCDFTSVVPRPSPTLGTPAVGNTYSLMPHFCDNAILISSPTNFSCLYEGANYGLYRLYLGDYLYQNSCYSLASGSSYPYYHRHYVPTQIKMRGIMID